MFVAIYFAFAQAASTARSSPVISVMLPGGIALDHAALRAISRALRWMLSAVSSSTPLGAVTMPSHTGSDAWHMLQRDVTISSTWAKAGCTLAAALASRGPAADNSRIAIMPAAATPHTHQGEGLPL